MEIVFHSKQLMSDWKNYDSTYEAKADFSESFSLLLHPLAIPHKSVDFLNQNWLYLYAMFPVVMPFGWK